MKQKLKIVIIDSGLGGLPYFDALKSCNINADFIYIADTANFPYGTKSHDLLLNIFEEMVVRINKLNPDALLIACNTASLHGGPFFKAKLNIPVITTRPSLSLAFASSTNKKIAVLATASSLSSDSFKKALSAFHPSSFSPIAATKLVAFIEENLISADDNEKYQAIKPFFNEIIALKCDTVVLGCTHFVHLKQSMAHHYPMLNIIDNSNDVANELLQAVGFTRNSHHGHANKAVIYQTSTLHQPLYKEVANYFGLTYQGII